jgi:hypothetical protein
MLEVLEGSIVTGKSGTPLKVVGINRDVLILQSADGESIQARRSAILQVISSPLKISDLKVGDVLMRTPHNFNGKFIPCIYAATVERLSGAGVWVRTNSLEAAIYHVSDMAIDEGWWKRVDESDGTEP